MNMVSWPYPPPHDPWHIILIILQALSSQTLRIHALKLNLRVSSSSAPPCRQVDFYPCMSKSLLGVGLQIDKFKAKGALKEIAIAKASAICVARVDVIF